MIKMVAEKFDGKSEGISFENFKTFYNVLFGGADLERAMFFLDNKNNGVKIVENINSSSDYKNIHDNHPNHQNVIRLTAKSSGK